MKAAVFSILILEMSCHISLVTGTGPGTVWIGTMQSEIQGGEGLFGPILEAGYHRTISLGKKYTNNVLKFLKIEV